MGRGYGLGGGTSRSSRFSDGMFCGFGPMESVFRSSCNDSCQSRPEKVPTVENKLPFTLEELYNDRNIVDASGKATFVEEHFISLAV